jgi:hypothetical protein
LRCTAAAASSCSIAPIDYTDKTCTGTCPAGWVCNQTTLSCVPSEVESPDWTPALTAVYRFESPAPALGTDATGHGLTLDSHGMPSRDTSVFIEGRASLSYPDTMTSYLSSDSAAFDTPSGTSFTFGGWFHVPDVNSDSILMRKVDGTKIPGNASAVSSPGFDFYIDHPAGPGLSCEVGLNGEGPKHAPVVANATWMHLICRYDDSQTELRLYTNGRTTTYSSQVAAGIRSGAGPFVLGCIPTDEVSCAPYVGNMDEVFFVNKALDDTQIGRIFACGIDGTHCRCKKDAPTEYESCGRATGPCEEFPLTACNAAF